MCVFLDSASAKKWIHRLVPKNQNDQFLKWSSGGRGVRNLNRRLKFLSNVERDYDTIDFAVHCISSTEGQISQFTQAFYLQNLSNITQKRDNKGRNCLIFKISDTTVLQVPVLRAAKLVWIFYCLKYMKDVNKLEGFILSDWFSCDSTTGGNKAEGIKTVNFLLSSSGIGLQLSIPHDPRRDEAELLSDWFSGLCNSSKSGAVDEAIAGRFKALTEREPTKLDAIEYACDFTIIES
jgi:hypothetical protein